ncbi:MAG TPA: DUF2071 domain-containing protein [Candidatus Obscuribacterales bacterium]
MIQKNPITMVGTIARCWLFVYRTPAQEARRLLPPQLEPVVHGDWSFWNVVVCQVRNMRPKLSPLPIGFTYWHVAYRLYVRCRVHADEVIEGLYFLRSDCDSPLIAVAGNVVTDFNFHCGRVSVFCDNGHVHITVTAPGADAYARINENKGPVLPAQSPFGSLDEASRFLKYKPNGISIDSAGRANVVHIVRDEQSWKSRLVCVEESRWSFFDDKDAALEICYAVEPVFYQWNRGCIQCHVCGDF